MTISAASKPKDRKTAWSGKVLIPLWTCQIISIGIVIGGYIWLCRNYKSYRYFDIYEVEDGRNGYGTFTFISSIVLIVLWFFAMFMVIFEIVRFAKKNLPASTMLKSQIILSVFVSVCFIIEMLGFASVLVGGTKNLVDFFGTVVALPFFYGTLIYTSVIYHRRKKAKRHSKDSYGMVDYDVEASSRKASTTFEDDK